MKRYFILLQLSFCSAAFGQDSSFDTLPKDFVDVWTEFSEALIVNDKEKIKALSLTCIHCSECAENTDAESTKMDAEREADADLFFKNFYNKYAVIPLETFIHEDFDLLFSSEVRARSQDSTKLFFVQHEKIKKKALNQCVRTLIKSKTSNHIEVLITVIDPNDNFEGAQYGLNFIETPAGYRFFAFYTIP